MSGARESARLWGFFAFLFWPWLVLLAVPGALAIAAWRLAGGLADSGSWYAVAGRWLLLVLTAPILLARLGWRSRRWKLVAAVGLLLPFFLAVLASLVVPEPSWQPGRGAGGPEPPGWRHPLGTNDDGVDLLTLVVHGCGNSYLVVTVSLAVILGVGVPLGVFLERRRWGRALRAAVAAFDSVPLLFGMLVLAAFASLWIGALEEQGRLAAHWHSPLRSLFLGGGIGIWLTSSMAFLVAERIAHFRRLDFIDASLASGIPLSRVVWHHILYRNSLAVIFILASQLAGLTVLFETSLGYLFSIGTAQLGGGFYHSLGQLLTTQEAKQAVLFLDPWWLFAGPMLFIALGILGFLVAGDGLGDLTEVRGAAAGRSAREERRAPAGGPPETQHEPA